MSTQGELAVSYGVSNEFYRYFLDDGFNYSCALFLSADDTLERAQENKLQFFYDGTKLTRDSRVLDIGCGWGGNLSFLSKKKGLRDLTGITLAEQQYRWLQEHPLAGVRVDCVDYRSYEPSTPFDAIISIGMFEHISTPQQVRSGEQIDIYRDYFRRAWEWSKPGAYFGLQSVIGGRVPRNREVLRDLAWATTEIFPGAISPRIEAIAASMNPYWEIVELKTRREHYARTSEEWLTRLRANKDVIVAKWSEQLFDDYERYLRACVTFFAGGYQSLAQFILRRVELR